MLADKPLLYEAIKEIKGKFSGHELGFINNIIDNQSGFVSECIDTANKNQLSYYFSLSAKTCIFTKNGRSVMHFDRPGSNVTQTIQPLIKPEN